jgi:hypothetical protein
MMFTKHSYVHAGKSRNILFVAALISITLPIIIIIIIIMSDDRSTASSKTIPPLNAI